MSSDNLVFLILRTPLFSPNQNDTDIFRFRFERTRRYFISHHPLACVAALFNSVLTIEGLTDFQCSPKKCQTLSHVCNGHTIRNVSSHKKLILSGGRSQGRLINMVDFYEWTEDTEFEISELVVAQLKRIQPISPEAQQYESAFHYALCWQSLFSTSDGLIGMGPNWLRRGDSVMLIRGAIVPYIFRHVDDNLKLQVEGLKKETEELEKELLAQKHSNDEEEQKGAMDTRRNIAKLRRKFIQTDGQNGRKDGWILIGEAYVEGVMRGEVLERQGNDIWERIAIV